MPILVLEDIVITDGLNSAVDAKFMLSSTIHRLNVAIRSLLRYVNILCEILSLIVDICAMFTLFLYISI